MFSNIEIYLISKKTHGEGDGMANNLKDYINQVLKDSNTSKDTKSSHKEIIEGYSIRNNSIVNIEDPYITFRSPEGQTFSLNKHLLSRHVLLLGGIGVGKTNVFNLLLKELFNHQVGNNNVTIIFDTKGDFINEFYEEGDIVIANDRNYSNVTYYWNLFDEIKMAGDEESQELMAKEIGRSLFSDRKSSSQPFFSNAAMDIFSKTIIHFIRCDRERNLNGIYLNNYELLKFFQQASTKTYINMCNRYPDFKGALSYFGDGRSNQALGVFGELNSMINDYFIGIFSKTSKDREFSMRRLVREKQNRKIFIEYDLTIGETLTPMYRLLIDMALKEALGRSHSEGDVNLIIDEFKLLPVLSHIDDSLNFGRSLGIKVVAGLQNITQLYDVYGDSRGAVIASGFSNIFAFKTIDPQSREYVSNLFGKNYYSLSYFNSAGEFVDENREGHSVEDWELMDLGIGQAVIGLANYRPFYFSFEEFRSSRGKK